MVRIFALVCITLSSFKGICQTEVSPQKFKNQLSTNLLLPFLGSVDLSYERTVANKWAVGVGAALYGNAFENLGTSDYSYGQETKYEITPFVRLYFNGAQKKSHFLEIFGSLSEVEESGRYIRHVNEEGYGVYTIGAKTFIVGGLGVGYGYRFLFLEDKLVLEPQFGIRTNFDVDFIFLNGALVRTGIKVGYRF